MRKILLIILSLVPLVSVAQTDNVSFYQEHKISELTDVYKMYNKRNDVADGYRIQVSFSNDRQEAYMYIYLRYTR